MELKYIYYKVKKFLILRVSIFLSVYKGIPKLGLTGKRGGQELNQTLQNWPLIGHYYCCLGPELACSYLKEARQLTLLPPERNFGNNLGKAAYFSQGQKPQ